MYAHGTSYHQQRAEPRSWITQDETSVHSNNYNPTQTPVSRVLMYAHVVELIGRLVEVTMIDYGFGEGKPAVLI